VFHVLALMLYGSLFGSVSQIRLRREILYAIGVSVRGTPIGW
jgi:hypothetical protein